MEKHEKNVDKKVAPLKLKLSFVEAMTACGVVMGFVTGLVCFYLTIPDSDYSFLKLPSSLHELQILRSELDSYTKDYTVQVLVGYCMVYICMQTFMIPGTVFLSLLAGSLFGVVQGVILVVCTATAGASSCYLMSRLIGKPLVTSFWPDKLVYFQSQVAKRKAGLLNYMLFLRVTPTLPHTFINVASPLVDVPYRIFFLGTLIGLIPAAFVTVKSGAFISGWKQNFADRGALGMSMSFAGVALGELRSVSDLYDINSVATLFIIGLVAVIPTLISRKK